MRELGGHVGEDARAKFDAFAQDTQGVLSHLLTGKQFGQRIGEIQAGLNFTSSERNAEIVIRQKQAAFRVRSRAAGIQKPGTRACGIHQEWVRRKSHPPTQTEERA